VKLICLIIMFALGSMGCTTVRFVEVRPDGTKIKVAYTYWLQDKTNKASLGDFTLETTNSADPAVEAFKEGLAAGAAGALKP